MTPNHDANWKLKQFFEQAYEKQLTDEEVLEYKNRLVKFFSLLIEIDQINKRKEVNFNEIPRNAQGKK